jgi:hypothetical protein
MIRYDRQLKRVIPRICEMEEMRMEKIVSTV